MTTRRQLLLGSGAVLASMGIGFPRLARADAEPGDLKFVFLFNPGGWDPTRVFATEFANSNVAMEPDADLATAGGITYVDHGTRPSVRAFMEAHHSRTLIMNGVLVRSIAHEICTMIAMTGSSSGTDPDWPAQLAAADRARYTLPHLVLDGPSFPGDLGVAVARTGVGGQLEMLLSGQALDQSEVPVRGINKPAEHIVDRYLARRASAFADGASSDLGIRLATDYEAALDKAVDLKDMQYVMSFAGGANLAEQAGVAVEALTNGLSRCVTIAYYGGQGLGWDTHANNDGQQAQLWQELFAGLNQLMLLLESTPGETTPTLAEETVVVVMSEMGRTPALNGFAGKDHWPYTSVMVTGPGITGDRVVGAYDANYYGLPLDTLSGDVDEGGQILSAEAVGATLLALADLDPGDTLMGVDPVMGVLS